MKKSLCVAVAASFVACSSYVPPPEMPPTPVTVEAEAPPLPADSILLTIFLRHDQSKSLAEIQQLQEDQGFWRSFPPPGTAIVSWYVVMGIGQVVTLRVPPAKLREVNVALERTAWKAFHTEYYATYDLWPVIAGKLPHAIKEGATGTTPATIATGAPDPSPTAPPTSSTAAPPTAPPTSTVPPKSSATTVSPPPSARPPKAALPPNPADPLRGRN